MCVGRAEEGGWFFWLWFWFFVVQEFAFCFDVVFFFILQGKGVSFISPEIDQ